MRRIKNVSFPNKTGEPPFLVSWTEDITLLGRIIGFNKRKQFRQISDAVEFYWKKVKEK
jgi:hypothetical protein